MNAAVFLDRDNTIIHNDGDLGDPKLIRMIQGAASAIASLRGLGYKVIVVTNQGGVARGKYGEADVEAMHQRINELILANSGATIDRFYFCPYHPDAVVEKYRAEHPWRKPQPGMVLQAARDFQLDLGQCWMIGDQVRDIQAGVAAGVRPILLRGDRGERLAAESALNEPYFVAANIIEAVKIVAQKRRPILPGEAFVEGPSGRIRPPLAAPMAAVARGVPAPAVPSPAAPVPSVATVPQPVTEPVSLPSGTAAETVVEASPAAAPVVTSVVQTPAPVTPPAASSVVPSPAAGFDQGLATQILQELRNQRQIGQEFSYLNILAILLQMIVVVCLLGSFWLGSKDPQLFLRFLGTGILLQLMTIAMLQFRR